MMRSLQPREISLLFFGLAFGTVYGSSIIAHTSAIVGESTILDIGLDTAFRELLQNSDDAEARPVEIRFETRVYLSRDKGDNVQSDKPGRTANWT